MPMTVNAIKTTPQVKSNNKNMLKHAAVNGAAVGAGAGAAASLIAAYSMVPKTMTKDALIKGIINSTQVSVKEMPPEILERSVDAIREQADELYLIYKSLLAKPLADSCKIKIPKVLLIGTVAAAAVGAGIAAIIHHNKNKEVPKTK